MKWVVVLAVAAPLALTGVANATPSLSATCQPSPTNCASWYRVPVKLKWVWDNNTSTRTGGDCLNWSERTFASDTVGTKVTCEVTEDGTGATAGLPVTLRIDRTQPSITGPGFGRPPDHGDWFNHPVAFGFTGQDATSGVESCTGGTYGGPDGVGVGISGSCRDVAGNVTSGGFTLNYDATPPPKPTVSLLPGNHRVAIRWSSALNEAEIVRVEKASSQAVVFRGATEKFTDTKLRNGHRYRYRVTLIDQAGNTSTAAKSAVPTNAPLLLPANGQHLRNPPMLAWKRVRHARYYNAQLLRGDRKVLSRWPRRTRLQLHERWRSRFGSGGVEGSASRCEPQPCLKRNVAVLALRALDALGLQGAERSDQLGPGLVRLDHVVDVAALGRRVGVGEVGLVVVD